MTNETVTIRIDGFAHGGRGVGRLDGKAVFVTGALPGELVEAAITTDRRRWAAARLVRVLEPAKGRVEPPCEYVPACGGCDLQHASPQLQLELLTRVVTEQLERLGGLSDPPVAPCRAVGPSLGYRRNVQLHPDAEGQLGFHRAGTHDVVAIERCLVAADPINEALAALSGAGGADHVAIRADDRGVAPVLDPGPGPLEVPAVDADVHVLQPDGSAVTLRGRASLEQTVGGVTYRYGAGDFFQVTAEGANAIVTAVLDALGVVGGQLAWDLYAGVGLLSVPLALAGAEVVAIESGRSACEHAVANAAAAGVDLVVERASVREFVGRPEHASEPPDIVLLDPPRDGAGAEVCTAIAGLEVPSVVYVACDPASLARDVRTFRELGYRLVGAQPLAMFPMTHHVEVVAELAR